MKVILVEIMGSVSMDITHSGLMMPTYSGE